MLATGLTVAAGLAVLGYDRLAPPQSQDNLTEALRGSVTELYTVWHELDALWQRLETGQTVSCEKEAVVFPYFVTWRTADRVAYPMLASVVDQLNYATRDLHRVADTWLSICRGPQAEVPEAIAFEARSVLERTAARLEVILDSLLR